MRQAVSAMQVNGGSCDCHRERSKGPWFLLTGKNVFEHRQEPWFLAALGMTAWTYAAQRQKPPAGGFCHHLDNLYGITPAGACGIVPVVVAAAASFSIL
jgi:hypothetical protein